MARREPGYARWLNALVLLGLGWLAILLELAPLGGLASSAPSPDFLFCVAAFLVVRRSRSTPAIMVLLLGLARDLIGGGAVGIEALTLLGAVELMRGYRFWLRRRSFVFELALAAALAMGMAALQVVALTITFAPSPALETLALGVLGTAGAYVAVAFLLRYGLRLRAEPQPRGPLGATP